MKYISRSNADWVRLLNLRDEETIIELRELLKRASTLYLAKRLPGCGWQEIGSLSDDMAQDATMDVLDKLSTFRGDSKFTTWAYSLAIHLCASEVLHMHYQNVRIDSQYPILNFTKMLRDNSSAENVSERRNILEIISEIIEGLPERQKRAVIGVCIKQLPVLAVAKSAGLNKNSLYKCLHDARVKILAGLENRCLTMGDVLATFED